MRDAFVSFARGEWQMPPKVYLPSPPNGDFRAMPVRGEGLAILKWVTSFPANPRRGLPTVTGVVLVSNADDGEPLLMMDARAVTALRTGAAAAVATQELAREDARTRSSVAGCTDMWVGRCMADAEYGPGVCFDPDPDAAGNVAAELGWEVGNLSEALACDVVCTITPGAEAVVSAAFAAAGSAPEPARRGRARQGRGIGGRRRASACTRRLFCDEWEQASHGGELTGAVAAGRCGERTSRTGSSVRRPRPWAGLGARDHPVRLDRPRYPGPGDRPRRPRGATGGRGEAPNCVALVRRVVVPADRSFELQ